MSIADTIGLLQAAKTNIAQAIREKGGTVNAGDGFADFPADIRTIPTGAGRVQINIQAVATASAINLTLSDAVPVNLAVLVTIDGTTTTQTITSGATTGSISVTPSASVRTASLMIVPVAYASMFDLIFPNTVEIPSNIRVVNFSVTNVSATGCRIVASDYPTSDIDFYIWISGEGEAVTGTLYNDQLSVDITWASMQTSRNANVQFEPASDQYSTYNMDETTFVVPPAGQTYTQLTYIEGNGTQFIHTDVQTANGMSIVVKFYGVCPSSTTGGATGNGSEYLWVGGNQVHNLTYNSNGARFFANNGSYYRYVSNSGLTSGRYIKAQLAIDGQTASSAARFGYIFGTTDAVFSQTNFSAMTGGGSATLSYGDIYIGRNPNQNNPSNFRFYGMEITEDNAITHNFVPARRDSDSAIGVLDTVTQTFYTNAGTGTFIYA